jgi:hypothetical protein
MPLPAGRFITSKGFAVAATTAVDLAWVDMNNTAVVPAEGDRIVLHSITINNVATAKIVSIFQDLDAGNDLDTTEILERCHFTAAGTVTFDYSEPVPTVKINAAGTNDLHIIASTTGNIDYIIRAKILQASS